MEWVFLALLAPALWAVMNIADKWILSNYFKGAFSYQVFTVLTDILIIPILFVLAPISFDPALFVPAMVLGIISGFSFVIYNKAMIVEEASRVISLMYMTPLFILPMAIVFLGEVLSPIKYVGIALLVVSAVLISYRKVFGKHRFLSLGMILILIWGVIWAGYQVATKWMLGSLDVWSFTLWTLTGTLISGMLMMLIPNVRKEFVSDIKRSKAVVYAIRIAMSMLYVVAMLSFYFAISAAPISIVGAIPSVQPAFVLLYVLLFSAFLPKIIREENTRNTIILKALAVVLIFIGTWAIIA
jgi:drug/metabolite transporter (DMT)-like permease